jgi:hypothetical protein
MAMTPDARPAKPHPDVKTGAARRDGLTKGDKAAPAALARPHLSAKPPSEDAPAREGAARSSAGGNPQQPPSQEPPDQERSAQAHRGGEQYLRLTVRVDEGELSIVDSQLVDGPLAQASAFQGGFAYEVTDGSRLLHAGSIPDLGVVRGFAHPNGTLEQERHHTYELSTYEFDARVPVPALRAADLSKVSIALYRVKQPEKGDAPHGVLSTESLSVQREGRLREIGRVVGVPASALAPDQSFQPPRPPTARSQARKVRSEDDEGEERQSDDEERGD